MFYLLLFTYLLGAFTFLPILLILFGSFIYLSSPTANLKITRPSNLPIKDREVNDDTQQSEVLSNKESIDIGLPKLYRAGWLNVRQTYESTQTGDGTYMGMLTNSYRSFMDQRSKDPKRSRPKDQFYVVLNQNVLFLYEDEDQVDCAAAIEVTLYDILLYPDAGPDGELYVKRRAICLKPQGQSVLDEPVNKSLNENSLNNDNQTKPERQIAGRPLPWFIFTKDNSDKEDWYHMLVASSKLSSTNPKTTFAKDSSLFDSNDMAKLVEGIDQQPDPIPMRWLNAMLGRIFLSTYKTSSLENWIIDKIMAKLTRVKTPSFLSAIKVREVNVGSSTPFFSKPMLKELNVNGDASMEVHVNYQGEFRITIETVATINLSSRFKPYVVNLVLAVVLKELEGNLLLKIKKPPTNRLWFGFTTMPRLVLQLDPVVSTRQIKWAMVLKPIESRIREVVLESIVLPHLDDLAFFDTQPYTHRGGIWGDAGRKGDLANLDAPSSDEVGTEDETEKIRLGTSSHDEKTNIDSQQVSSGSAISTGRDQSTSPETLRQRGGPKFSANLEPSTDNLNPIVSEPTSLGYSSHSPDPKRNSWFSNSRNKPDTSSLSSSQASPRVNYKHDTSNVSADLDGEALAKLKEILSTRSESNRVVSSSSPNFASFHHDLRPVIPVTISPEAERSDPVNSAPLTKEPELESTLLEDSRNSTSLTSGPIPPEPLLHSDKIHPQPPPESSIDGLEESPAQPIRRLPPPPPPRTPAPPTNLPPPQRQTSSLTNRPSESSLSSSITTIGTSSTGSILNQLRTRAADKEALAASMTQAKDVVRKWGASWTSKRRTSQATSYTNGFNPIPIDKLAEVGPSMNSLVLNRTSEDTGDMDLHPTKNSDLFNQVNKTEEGNEIETRSSYRAHRAAKEKESSEEQSSSPINSSAILTHEPRLFDLRHKTSTSRLSVATSEDGSMKQRNRTIYTSNGQFIPAAPQSTTGLNISSAQLVLKSDDVEQGQTTESPPIQSSISIPAISTERSSYKPAPMMAIPGIKDSSHRFALGSDSILNTSQDVSVESSAEIKPESDNELGTSPSINDSVNQKKLGVVSETSSSLIEEDPLTQASAKSVDQAWGL
ncbi:hypothetical protein CROQUDRAFT_718316 [Cronartium quercuum f. sp. fusiforme G11]|uniref:SMP-LTD domain-containing protein n=1 Tax=Cronartium quercuum f. sp. fusiforme G11 TaxID=708437 RepID=A0A9P6T724_9BASI|nr:hypothetical protein CROQUDRAFT_718316 [Cronartium quercuum f. sp. fusiforme G11]